MSNSGLLRASPLETLHRCEDREQCIRGQAGQTRDRAYGLRIEAVAVEQRNRDQHEYSDHFQPEYALF